MIGHGTTSPDLGAGATPVGVVRRVIAAAPALARPPGPRGDRAPVPVPLTVDPRIDAAPIGIDALSGDVTGPPRVPTASIRTGTAVRPATLADVPAVHALVAHWARAGENLPRSEAELVATVHARALVVAVRESQVVACAILAPYDRVLAEIRSVGVDPQRQGAGAGSAVVRHMVAKAALLDLHAVFVLTRAPGFFDRLGFARTSIDTLPDKIRRDCIRCPRIDRCDEIAMVRPLHPIGRGRRSWPPPGRASSVAVLASAATAATAATAAAAPSLVAAGSPR